jgi:hypothetical protein
MTKKFLHVQLINPDIDEMLLDNVQHLVVIIQYIIQLNELDHQLFFEVNHHYYKPFLNKNQIIFNVRM